MKKDLAQYDLTQYLEVTMKYEMKWMYHYDVDDEAFGVETDKYIWCRNTLEGNCSVHELVEYFEKYYPNDEAQFISRLKEFM